MSQFYVNCYGGTNNKWVTKPPDPIKDKLMVYEHPMRTDTNCPKVCDGKATLSLGVKVQAVTTLIQQSDVMELLVFPGNNVGMLIEGAQHADPELDVNNLRYKRHFAMIAMMDDDYFLNTTGVQNEQEWRMVSQQLKLTSINAAHDYNGWWEAIRYSTVPSAFNTWTDRTEDENGNPLSVVNAFIGQEPGGPRAAAWPQINSDLTINPTYCTGKVKDLHRYKFQLLPSLNNHDFVHMDSIGQNNLRSAFVDDCFDCLYIRIHGTPINEELPGTRPTTIMAHLVGNQEIIYRENTLMTRYHTECYDAYSQLKNVKKRMRENNKAAKPMFNAGV